MNENDINNHIGQKIRERRHVLGMNQTDLGKKIGVTFQQIQKYEKGHNKIVASKLYDLANQLDIPISYFFEDFKNNDNINTNSNSSLMVNEESAEFDYSDRSDPSTREAISIVKIYNNIHSKETRKKLLLFLKAIASETYLDERD
jgi:transcriptional regulator with XRE-family HTH domain